MLRDIEIMKRSLLELDYPSLDHPLIPLFWWTQRYKFVITNALLVNEQDIIEANMVRLLYP